MNLRPIVGVAVALGSLCGQTTLSFFSRETTVGVRPLSAITGDFNRDGNTDIAVSNNGSSSISILLGAGNGSFSRRIDTPLPNAPQALAAGDFNGDGRLDLAVITPGANSVSILLGKGDGTFREPIETAVSGPSALAVADFNGDGRLDLAVASEGTNSIVILLGNGNGTFHAAGSFPVGFGPASIALGDFNGDGAIDIAVANTGSLFISILVGNGNGTFQPSRNVSTGGFLISIEAADFNNDGNLDLAVLAGAGNAGLVVVLLGNGDGTFENPLRFPVGGSPVLPPVPAVESIPEPSAMTAADVNRDGVPDLVVALASNNNVAILIGLGDGSFETPQTFSAGMGPFGIAVADLDGNEQPDLILPDASGNSVSVLLNNTAAPARPTLTPASVVNAASFLSGPLAPGEIVSVFGSDLGPAYLTISQPEESGFLPTTLAGTQFLIDGVASPLLVVSATQITGVVPYEIAGRPVVKVQVESVAGLSNALSLRTAQTTPALFSADSSGFGQGAILNEDGSLNGISNPAAPGSVVILFGTGLGQTSPPGVDGMVLGDVLPTPLRPVLAAIGGVSAEVVSAAAVRGQAGGLFEVRVRIPSTAPSGDLPVVMTVGNIIGTAASQPGVTVRVR